MLDIHIPIIRLADDVELPAYAFSGDAGLDLRSHVAVTVEPFQRILIDTGLAIAIPEGYAGFVLPRSGLSSSRGLTLVNAPGLIDSKYRGEIKIAAINIDPRIPVIIDKGDRIAQLVILQAPQVVLDEREDLGNTDRGAGGFGSSGL